MGVLNRLNIILGLAVVSVIILAGLSVFLYISITDLNNRLWLESEEHALEVMNTIDESVVSIIACPAQDVGPDMSSVIFVDENGSECSIGTGFSVNERGHILTADHVIGKAENKAEKIIILTKDGTKFELTGDYAHAWNQDTDVAMIYLDTGLPPVELLDEGYVGPGTEIGFIGHPLEAGPPFFAVRTKTVGNISALTTIQRQGKVTATYVINSFVNQGNSGGPVFSLKTGKVIGVINATYTDKIGIGLSSIINRDNLRNFLANAEKVPTTNFAT